MCDEAFSVDFKKLSPKKQSAQIRSKNFCKLYVFIRRKRKKPFKLGFLFKRNLINQVIEGGRRIKNH